MRYFERNSSSVNQGNLEASSSHFCASSASSSSLSKSSVKRSFRPFLYLDFRNKYLWLEALFKVLATSKSKASSISLSSSSSDKTLIALFDNLLLKSCLSFCKYLCRLENLGMMMIDKVVLACCYTSMRYWCEDKGVGCSIGLELLTCLIILFNILFIILG